MKRCFLSLLLAFAMPLCCLAQRSGTVVYEPVRFEDGTPVDAAAEGLEELFAQDRFVTDTTLTENGDTLLTVRHTSAYVFMQIDGLPAGADKVLLVPMKGEPAELAVNSISHVHSMPVLIRWMAMAPARLPAAAVIAETAEGGFRSARLPEIDLQPGIAYRWTATCISPDAPASDLQTTPLPATFMDIEPGEYSGITHISGHRYAVVHDKLKGGGIVFFSIPVDEYGNVGTVRMQVADGTAEATGLAQDCEGIAFVPATGTLFVSTENQEIRGYDLTGRKTGNSMRIPADLKGIQGNRGFEALTYDEATDRLWTTTESPLKKDTFLPRLLRLQRFTPDGEPAERFLYQMEEPLQSAANTQAYVHGVPALAALPDGRLVVLEREVYVPNGGFWDKLTGSFTKVDLYLVDPVHDTAGILRKSLLCSFQTSALDLANFEGMCLGPTLPDGQRTLLLIADSQNGSGGLTQEYVKVILVR